ncbi:HAMP domain-containing protein [Paenibacillus sp. GSMTC-2017]|uniref:sensor histidine kinase n=1 Tax=Paenibacillus sp. GSMTC-2017 TaxID=2794350 RepID=UPI0018D8B07E|nr:HAMP domain-containing sensor histidine kinase [Paenibacillus sp. GSMTC-2017]MBH5318901.1 HAMP domain-containing protein [Paenibacillus sp. GSMTC-2017]
MKTLYVKIVSIFIFITVVSGFIALLLANSFYTTRLQHYNEDKVLPIAEQVRDIFESTAPNTSLPAYLNRIAKMGFQIYLVDQSLKSTVYGDPFKHTAFDQQKINLVLQGETYLGKLEEQRLLEITSYFENSIRNTVGLPIQWNGDTYAMFLRPNLEQQVGEIRVLLALLLGYAFILSLAFIVILTRTIVKPLKALKAATKKIVGGNYKMELDVKRKDEIGDLARHFSQMASSLERLDEMRQEFVANVSHEFQTPVTSIQGFTQAIIDGETTEDEQRHFLQIVNEESKRLSSLSKQLLTLAALDSESTIVNKQPYRLDEQLRQILIITEWQWSQKNLELTLELPEITITADEALLHQVWLNLMTNSIKFSQNGAHIRIDISVAKTIEVTFTDTGIGIPPSELPFIFDRFYKADKARNRALTGSGLGLSISRKIIELHGGTIDASSVPGQETRFTINLPSL